MKVKVLATQSCLTLCNPMDCTPGSSVYGIIQAKILEWVAIPSSRGSFPPRGWTWVSCIAGGFFTGWATREDANFYYILTHICTYSIFFLEFKFKKFGIIHVSFFQFLFLLYFTLQYCIGFAIHWHESTVNMNCTHSAELSVWTT